MFKVALCCEIKVLTNPTSISMIAQHYFRNNYYNFLFHPVEDVEVEAQNGGL